jgi:hypothetical protein
MCLIIDKVQLHGANVVSRALGFRLQAFDAIEGSRALV